MTNTETLHKKFLECSGVSTDTRAIEQSQIFFCLKGPNFNANSLAQKAIESGAKYVVIDDKEYFDPNNKKHILVENTLEALQKLANFHRKYTNPIIISTTGSNGKTTTKELIHAVLKKKYNTIATIGNLNNHIGVPLTLLRITKNTEIAIVEMGANHQKEIEKLCQIAEPNYGYITNFGKAHLEGFGGIEGVIKGKSELYTFLQQNNQKAFVRYDDPIQLEKSKKIKHISFSFAENDNANYHFSAKENNEYIAINYHNNTINTNLSGSYNLPNIAVAIVIGLYFEIEFSEIKKAIEEYIPTNNRSQWIKTNSNEILMDSYNANPSSMKVSIENFSSIDKKNKIMILGDMFELGEYSDEEHKKIIKQALHTNIKTYFVGQNFFKNKISNNSFFFYPTFEEFSKKFHIHNISNQTLLIKGSRAMALERILNQE